MLANMLRAKHIKSYIPELKLNDTRIQSPEAISKAFKLYYEKLYNLQTHHMNENLRIPLMNKYLKESKMPKLPALAVEELNRPLDQEELKGAVASLKLGKAPGPDGFTGAYYKKYLHILSPYFLKAFNLREGEITFPKDALRVHITLIHKEGKDPLLCQNYRPISLINIDSKLFTKILATRRSLLLQRLYYAANSYDWLKISYGARDTLLSDRKMYPNFFRTIPDDEMQYVAIVKLLERMKWNWVGIITSDDEYGEREIRQLSKYLTNHEICIEFKILVSKESYKKIISELRTSSTEVLIICGSFSMTYYKFLWINLPYIKNKTFILPSSWTMSNVYTKYSLEFTYPHFYIRGIHEYFKSFNLSSHPDDPLVEDILITEYECFSKHQMKNWLLPQSTGRPLKNCNLETLSTSLHISTDETPFRVYIAVYILAQALHDMYYSFKINNKKTEINSNTLRYKEHVGSLEDSFDPEIHQLFISKMNGTHSNRQFRVTLENTNTSSTPSQGRTRPMIQLTPQTTLSRYVKEVHYKAPNGKDMFFNDKGEVPSPLEITHMMGYNEDEDLTHLFPVGHFDGSLSESQQLTLEPEDISWKDDKVPWGRCSEECLPGFRKSVREGYHSCCYNCAPCSEGEISNHSDSENCEKCPDNKWPNKDRRICIDRIIEYLSYEEDILALFISITTVMFASLSLFILGLFFWFRSTPIVRANNRNLSFILLFSLMLSFLSVFLFLGRPVDITCMLQQVSFGIVFTVSLSSILAKTIMVFIAFKATRPGSSCRKWVGVKLPNTVMLFCSLIQVMIGVLWSSISPPFQENDLHTYPGKIIIQCNEGSVIGFYSVLGYMGFLAAVSFVLAFMVRTLPDSFNEAKYITFSMLVFCSVWIAMIPAYLSARGKYIVAVEIFAILTSSAGILACIFFPKLYILLFKPELNTRKSILARST
ncbi:vomeronasal type-2 receptor 26-like [Mantella aurantiaca]